MSLLYDPVALCIYYYYYYNKKIFKKIKIKKRSWPIRLCVNGLTLRYAHFTLRYVCSVNQPLAPVTKKPAPEIRLGSTQPVNSVGKTCPPYFTARVYPACIIK